MKKLLTILLMCFFVININAQGEEEESFDGEIRFFIYGSHSGLKFKSEAVSGYPIWEPRNYTDTVLNITSVYQGGEVSTNGTQTALYFRRGEGYYYNSIAHGYYKISVATIQNPNSILAYFFYDTRTSKYTTESVDVELIYNYSSNTFYTNDGNYTVINETTQKLWELNDEWGPNQITDYFEPYTPTNLSVSNNNGAPKVQWTQPYENTAYHSGFYIYRAVKHQNETPSANDFTLIATINNKNIREYTDYDVAVGSGWKAYYKLKTRNVNLTSEFSQVVNINISGFAKEGHNLSDVEYSFKLNQNYPNPFNPSTVINYSVPSNNKNIQYVSLKVYDVLGNEIITLVNENKEPGNYNVEFSTDSKVNSGIYFYSLIIGNNIEIKKMILLK